MQQPGLSMIIATFGLCGTSSEACKRESPVEIESLLGTISIPETLELANIGLRSDSESPRGQDRSSHRDAWRNRRATLAALPAKNPLSPFLYLIGEEITVLRALVYLFTNHPLSQKVCEGLINAHPSHPL